MSESANPYRYVGTRHVRHDGPDKVTGRAAFGADLALPGMLHGRVLRSPHAHARIVSIDTSAAAALPGVKAVASAADLPDHAPSGEWFEPRELTRNILAREKVLYDGHALAAVAAIDARTAEHALELIRVEYELLPPVLDLDQAQAPGAPLLDPELRCAGPEPKPAGPTNVAAHHVLAGGDIAAGFARADVIVERSFTTPTVHQGYIEPHAVVARTTSDGHAVVWCCTQSPFAVRAYSARLLGMDVSQIKVIPSEIGGGFGGKTTVYLEPLAVLLSRKAGRPVKLVMTREECFRASGPASATRIRVKLGATRAGKLTAAQAVLEYEAGAFRGSPMTAGAMTIFAPYELENFQIDGYDVLVNKPKVAAYRAPGAPMAAFAAESAIDELARALRMDPIDFRIRNAVREGSTIVYGPKLKAIGLIECLEALRKHPHYQTPLGPHQGRGVAAGFWFNGNMQSSAHVHLNEDGTATVVSGCPDIGGSRVSLALMAAEELGIGPERIRPIVADTETIGYNDGTGGSRVTFATGTAVIEAARDVVRQLRERAALTWELAPEQVRWENGCAVAAEDVPERPAPLSAAELARAAVRTGGPISGRAAWTARGNGPSFAAHLCDVEVDEETGLVRVIRYTAAQDAGRAIHPSYVEGQYQGGVAQGIGWALSEAYVYDAQGRLQNPGFLDYRMPVASDLPMIEAIVIEVPNPGHPYGVRGVGETSIVPPLAAVANALHQATGIRFTDLPLHPPRVLAALESRGQARLAWPE
jgi:CO/xanthine dehydrogenase Mo-binding subunit